MLGLNPAIGQSTVKTACNAGYRARKPGLSIVGPGRIGRAVAERLVRFNIDVSYFARAPRETPDWT